MIKLNFLSPLDYLYPFCLVNLQCGRVRVREYVVIVYKAQAFCVPVVFRIFPKHPQIPGRFDPTWNIPNIYMKPLSGVLLNRGY